VSTLILGIGNILLGDEGIGVRAVEAFADRYRIPDGVEVIDGGTTGMGLLDLIAGRERVIIVDAVKMDAAPGTIVRLNGEEIPPGLRQRLSPHHLGIGDVLAVLTVIDEAPDELTVIGIEPADLDFGVGLSPVIEAKLDAVVTAIAAELTRLGLAPEPRAETAIDTDTVPSLRLRQTQLP
jgi:hydrogenase maturation protease